LNYKYYWHEFRKGGVVKLKSHAQLSVFFFARLLAAWADMTGLSFAPGRFRHDGRVAAGLVPSIIILAGFGGQIPVGISLVCQPLQIRM
jgi:hypothetical protein